MATINWNDPAERARLSARVSTAEYNRLVKAHIEASTISTVNGYQIRPVSSRFGRLFTIATTTRAFATLAKAEEFAASLPSREAIG